jgi:hypothetical protein
VLESGAYYIGVGSTSDCRANPLGALCEPFQLALSSSYNAVCSAACEMWAKGCAGMSLRKTLVRPSAERSRGNGTMLTAWKT